LQNEDSTEREIAKSARKNTENIFKIVRLSRKLKTSFMDIVFILIEVMYDTEVFENIRNIERAYQVAYQKVISKGNYLEILKEEMVTQLLSYIEQTSYLRPSSKGKGKDTRNITLLILPIRI